MLQKCLLFEVELKFTYTSIFQIVIKTQVWNINHYCLNYHQSSAIINKDSHFGTCYISKFLKVSAFANLTRALKFQDLHFVKKNSIWFQVKEGGFKIYHLANEVWFLYKYPIKLPNIYHKLFYPQYREKKTDLFLGYIGKLLLLSKLKPCGFYHHLKSFDVCT